MKESDTSASGSNATALEFLYGADGAMAEEELSRAAALMWKAVEATFIELAEERGLQSKDLWKIATEIVKGDADQRSLMTINILMAEALRDHSETNPLERYELEEDVLESFLEGTREFVLMHHGKLA